MNTYLDAQQIRVYIGKPRLHWSKSSKKLQENSFKNRILRYLNTVMPLHFSNPGSLGPKYIQHINTICLLLD